MNLTELKISTIISEREGLRNEIIELEKNVHSTVLYFFTLLGIISGLIFEKDLIKNMEIKNILLFGISQIEFLLALYIILIMSNINIHTGYIKALEKKLNTLLQENISLWETEITDKYLFHPKRSFFIALTVILVLFIGLFFVLIMNSQFIQTNLFIKLLISFELIIVINILILMAIEKRSVTKNISRKLFKKE